MTIFLQRLSIASALLSAIFLLASPVHAQYSAPQAPEVQYDAQSMLNALLPQLDGSDNRGVARVQSNSAATSGGAPKATLIVTFEQSTGRLTIEGMRTLRALAAALQDPRLQGNQFQIASHGYAAADPQLMVRTNRQAQSIAEHLAGFYNLDIQLMQPIGLGAQYLANPANPEDPINNRVEIINLSAG